ncbi:MAG TPA: tetratricopeptide repeat protein, partial [Parafilimonas sp.]|nr:tetratricopeptide repeat protein [Parafilimonas sp.]
MRSLYKLILLFYFILFTASIFAQTPDSINALKQRLKTLQQKDNYYADSNYAKTLTDLAYIYTSSYPDSAIILLADKAAQFKAAGYSKGEINAYMLLGDAYETKGLYDKAMENYNASFRIAQQTNTTSDIPLILNRIGIIHLNQGNYPEALSKFYASLKSAENTGDNDLIGATLNNIAYVQYNENKFSEAESTFTERLKLAKKTGDTNSMSIAYNSIGEIDLQQKNTAKALDNLTLAHNLAVQMNDIKMVMITTLSLAEVYYETDSLLKADSLFQYALKLSKQTGNGISTCNALIGLAKTQLKQGLPKQALPNALNGLQRADSMGQVEAIRDANEVLSDIYAAMNDNGNALKYYKAYKFYSDSMNNITSQRAVAIERDKYAFSKKENEYARKALQQRWIIISAFAALLLLAIILWLINRNRQHLNHVNKELHKKNEVIETQKIKAEETLAQLQSTQQQLIQSEKMASLGELTAGIAHEIQNPLNFVNNFSDVNQELLAELKDEIKKGNTDEANAIANDIIENEEKINHHGKRADAIVKNMLQHSRATKGVKEPTDINALCDEYLRLAYHGMRAKDKSFNADFKTDFDESIGKINTVSQDIGRV